MNSGTIGALDVRALLNKGGSKTGVHYFMNLASCPRKARLNAEAKLEGQGETSEDMAVGTFFHKLAELWHIGLDPAVLPRVDPDGDVKLSAALAEAWRLFDFYVSYADRGYWGTPIAAEQTLEWPRPGTEGKLTGTIDLAVSTDASHPWIAQYEGPGVYLIDYKTHKAKPGDVHMKDAYSLQFTAYAWLWKMKHGKYPKGTLVHHLVRHQKLELGKSALTTYVPPPTDNDLAAMFAFFSATEKVPADFANLSQCFNYGACSHLLSGRCTRS